MQHRLSVCYVLQIVPAAPAGKTVHDMMAVSDLLNGSCLGAELFLCRTCRLCRKIMSAGLRHFLCNFRTLSSFLWLCIATARHWCIEESCPADSATLGIASKGCGLLHPRSR